MSQRPARATTTQVSRKNLRRDRDDIRRLECLEDHIRREPAEIGRDALPSPEKLWSRAEEKRVIGIEAGKRPDVTPGKSRAPARAQIGGDLSFLQRRHPLLHRCGEAVTPRRGGQAGARPY